MKSFLILLLFAIALPYSAQTPSYDELVFEADSITTAYKPVGKNYVFIKSKRGSDGVAKSSRADSILALPVTEIVLVFSELSANSINNRLEANQERWENLIKTYPQYFQFSTTLKELCQCKIGGDTAIFKKGNGFYVYFTGEEPKKAVAEKKVEESPKTVKTETKKSEEAPASNKTKKSETKEVAKVKEEPKKEKQKEKEKEKEPEKEPEEAVVQGPEQTLDVDMTSETVKKKTGYTKPKRSKNLKACRPPCYEGGDEGLNVFFKENITLDKKQKRQVKSSISVAKLQLNFDGSVKKAMVTGTDPILNEMVSVAIKNMDLWNPMVRGGVTVKSEVKLTLKYDKATKAIKPFEVMITPRPNPKCITCMTDEEIFGKE